MPHEKDYDFGNQAVSAGHLKQDQLEECIELLVALERVGSKQRLWQIVQRKAYMSDAAIAEIQASVEGAGAKPAQEVYDVAPATSGEVVEEETPEEPRPAAPFGLTADPKLKEAADWNIASEVEVEPVSDPFLRRGTKVPRADAVAPTPVKGFKPGDLRLTCIKGPLEGRRFVIARSSMVIGREAGLDLTVPDAAISRRHAEIVLGPARAEVKDLGSRNGVFVNGARVAAAPIRPGDTIRIHESLFVVEEVPPRPQPRKS